MKGSRPKAPAAGCKARTQKVRRTHGHGGAGRPHSIGNVKASTHCASWALTNPVGQGHKRPRRHAVGALAGRDEQRSVDERPHPHDEEELGEDGIDGDTVVSAQPHQLFQEVLVSQGGLVWSHEESIDCQRHPQEEEPHAAQQRLRLPLCLLSWRLRAWRSCCLCPGSEVRLVLPAQQALRHTGGERHWAPPAGTWQSSSIPWCRRWRRHGASGAARGGGPQGRGPRRRHRQLRHRRCQHCDCACTSIRARVSGGQSHPALLHWQRREGSRAKAGRARRTSGQGVPAGLENDSGFLFSLSTAQLKG